MKDAAHLSDAGYEQILISREMMYGTELSGYARIHCFDENKAKRNLASMVKKGFINIK